MTGMGIVWLVHGETGSFGIAGVVVGGFAVGEAVICPQVARLIDRYGQPRVLPWSLGVHGGAVALLVGAAVAHGPVWLLVAAGGLAGGSIPQVGALTAARWSVLLRGTVLLPAAFTLETLSIDVAYLTGPAVAVLLATTVAAPAGTVGAAFLIVIGGLVFASLRRTAPPPAADRPRDSTERGLLTAGFGVLLYVNFAMGGFFGSMQLSVSAFAEAHHVASAAGVLYAVMSCASILVGLAYGRRRWSIAPAVQLGFALSFLAVAGVPLLFVDSTAVLGIALVLPGMAIAPTIVLSSTLIQGAADSRAMTQAFTWVNSASVAGMALAASGAGQLVDQHGPSTGFLIPIAASGSAALLVWFFRSAMPAGRQQVTAPVPSA